MLYPLQRGAGYPLSALELPCLSPLETPAGDPEGIHLPSYFQGRGQLREKPGWIPAALSLGSFAGIWPGRREISRVEPAHPQLNRTLRKAAEASWSSLPRRLLAALGPALPLQAPSEQMPKGERPRVGLEVLFARLQWPWEPCDIQHHLLSAGTRRGDTVGGLVLLTLYRVLACTCYSHPSRAILSVDGRTYVNLGTIIEESCVPQSASQGCECGCGHVCFCGVCLCAYVTCMWFV